MSHFRPTYLKRSLDYYSNFKNINILVADSSDNEFLNLKKYPNIEYFHHPNTTMAEKICKTLKKVKTPYVSLSGDDDFILSSALNKCVVFIDDNPDYSSAIGRSGFFYKKQKYDKYTFRLSDDKIPQENEKTEERITSLFCNYDSYFYSVIKTELAKKIWLKVSENVDELRFNELLFNFLLITYGKVSVLSSLHFFEEFSTDSDGQTIPTLMDYYVEGSYQKRYEKFKKCLFNEIQSETSLSKSEILNLLDKGMNNYFGYKVNYKPYIKKILFKLNLLDFIKSLKEKLYTRVFNNNDDIYRKLAMYPQNINAYMNENNKQEVLLMKKIISGT